MTRTRRVRTLVLGLLMAVGFAGVVSPPTRAAAAGPHGGVTLDLFGGLHAFGGVALNPSGAPYWSGWDIARAVAVIPDGSGGWTLDGYGGIHAWGAAPAITAPVYWSGWDIARALVVLPDHHSGYVMDGYGGLHAFGSAPTLAGPYWNGWDIARGFEVAVDGSNNVVGAWLLDGWGGLHTIGSPPNAVAPEAYHQGHDVWQKFHTSTQGVYAVGRWGVVSANPGVMPDWSGYADWGSWNAVRDIVLTDPTSSSATAQPVSAEAGVQFLFATNPAGVAARPDCAVPASAVRPGKVILISLVCQQLSTYQNGSLVADTLVTTGRPALPTLRGWTNVISKASPFRMVSSWPPGSPYYYSPSWVQYVVWFRSNGYGIHDAYWEPDSALGPSSEYTSYASHGCVHVPLSFARALYAWADNGIPVGVF